MRQPDINRAKRALEHVEAAMTLLESIKWENVSGEEYTLKQSCNRLLKEGAACCTCAEDVLRLLELTPQKPIAPAERDRPSGNEALVLASIYGEPRHTDDIAKATGLSPQEVANILIGLEIKGKVSPITTGLYIRK